MTIIEHTIQEMMGEWYYYIIWEDTQYEYTNYILVDSDAYSLSSVKVYIVSIASSKGILSNIRWSGVYADVKLAKLLEYERLEDGDTKDKLIASYTKKLLQQRI